MEQLMKHRNFLKYGLLLGAVIICGIVYLIRQGGFSGAEGSAGEYTADETAAVPVNAAELKTDAAVPEIEETSETLYYIYVCGQVNAPGVYQCAPQTRVYALIEMAGGFTPEADDTALNLVETVTDGQKLYVPVKGDDANGTAPDALQPDKVNINTAAKEQLMTLPGIGASRAADIIAYRTENGRFTDTQDLMKVPGIKSASYEKLKAYICVS